VEGANGGLVCDVWGSKQESSECDSAAHYAASLTLDGRLAAAAATAINGDQGVLDRLNEVSSMRAVGTPNFCFVYRSEAKGRLTQSVSVTVKAISAIGAVLWATANVPADGEVTVQQGATGYPPTDNYNGYRIIDGCRIDSRPSLVLSGLLSRHPVAWSVRDALADSIAGPAASASLSSDSTPPSPPATGSSGSAGKRGSPEAQAEMFCTRYWNLRRASRAADSQSPLQGAANSFAPGLDYGSHGDKLVFAHEQIPGAGQPPTCTYMLVGTITGHYASLLVLNADPTQPVIDVQHSLPLVDLDLRNLRAQHVVALIVDQADLQMKIPAKGATSLPSTAPPPPSASTSTTSAATAPPASPVQTSSHAIGTDSALKVYACPTTGPGSSHTYLPRLPDPKPPTVSASVRSQLAIYANNGLYVIAPFGWSCSATERQDGTDALIAYPRGQSSTTPIEAVAATLIPACSSCIADQACVYFKSARKLLLRGDTCLELPAQEQHVQTRPTSIDFADPPGVAGSGFASGGANPANGVQIFVSRTGDQHAARETCTLPQSQHALCTAILDDFINRYAGPASQAGHASSGGTPPPPRPTVAPAPTPPPSSVPASTSPVTPKTVTTTYSSGLNQAQITVPQTKGSAINLRVAFKIAGGSTSYTIHLNNEVALIANSGGSAFGDGSGCQGSFTTFDDSAARFLYQGQPPYLGSYKPDQNSLSDLLSARPFYPTGSGLYQLYFFDPNGTALDPSSLPPFCWKILITR
jgi:hypothetical protein